MHFLNPIAQRIHHKFKHIRILNIKACAGSGAVVIIALVVFAQRIIRGVIYTAIAQGWAKLIALSRMIVYDIKIDFQAFFMHGFDHVFKFINFAPYQIILLRCKK